jgi:hypothetical protein
MTKTQTIVHWIIIRLRINNRALTVCVLLSCLPVTFPSCYLRIRVEFHILVPPATKHFLAVPRAEISTPGIQKKDLHWLETVSKSKPSSWSSNPVNVTLSTLASHLQWSILVPEMLKIGDVAARMGKCGRWIGKERVVTWLRRASLLAT